MFKENIDKLNNSVKHILTYQKNQSTCKNSQRLRTLHSEEIPSDEYVDLIKNINILKRKKINSIQKIQRYRKLKADLLARKEEDELLILSLQLKQLESRLKSVKPADKKLKFN